jgi:plasmid stabilization system protein ParE
VAYKVIFRAQARDEAVEAAAYIADQGYPQSAEQWYGALEAAVASLSEMPHRCQYARENALIPGAELRQLIFKSHRLIFTVRGDDVHVLHVRHTGRQDMTQLESE